MTNAELSVLSLVGEHARHGYEIEKIIETRGIRDWTEIGFSSIYYLLNKLEKVGFVESNLMEPSGRGPARKMYTITKEGRLAQIQRTLESLSNPQAKPSSFLLGLSNVPIISREEQIASLRSYLVRLKKKEQHLSESVERQNPIPEFVEAMFDYSRSMIEAEKNWIKKYIEQVEAGDAKD